MGLNNLGKINSSASKYSRLQDNVEKNGSHKPVR